MCVRGGVEKWINKAARPFIWLRAEKGKRLEGLVGGWVGGSGGGGGGGGCGGMATPAGGLSEETVAIAPRSWGKLSRITQASAD